MREKKKLARALAFGGLAAILIASSGCAPFRKISAYLTDLSTRKNGDQILKEDGIIRKDDEETPILAQSYSDGKFIGAGNSIAIDSSVVFPYMPKNFDGEKKPRLFISRIDSSSGPQEDFYSSNIVQIVSPDEIDLTNNPDGKALYICRFNKAREIDNGRKGAYQYQWVLNNSTNFSIGYYLFGSGARKQAVFSIK